MGLNLKCCLGVTTKSALVERRWRIERFSPFNGDHHNWHSSGSGNFTFISFTDHKISTNDQRYAIELGTNPACHLQLLLDFNILAGQEGLMDGIVSKSNMQTKVH
jgi:hypothetical protein